MRLTQQVGPTDHVVGRRDAPVTLVEYLDYECPFCSQVHHVVGRALSQVGDLVRFVPRHFPLSEMHPHALLAAQAAEAAAAQDRFWDMHSTLFEDQDALEPADLVSYADALGLDVPRFVESFRNGVHLPKVQDDFRGGLRSGVSGTPTFFINGMRHIRGWDGATLSAAIRDAARVEQRHFR